MLAKGLLKATFRSRTTAGLISLLALKLNGLGRRRFPSALALSRMASHEASVDLRHIVTRSGQNVSTVSHGVNKQRQVTCKLGGLCQ